jgi:hypothetical protein
MTRINQASLEPFLAFGKASIAICKVNELAHRVGTDAQANNQLDEIRAAHARLRELFADGFEDAVCVLANDVMERASRLADALSQDQGPSGS